MEKYEKIGVCSSYLGLCSLATLGNFNRGNMLKLKKLAQNELEKCRKSVGCYGQCVGKAKVNVYRNC